MFKFSYKRNICDNKKGGLTLVELLVVVSLFMIITGITIFSYGKFNSSISTQNLADDIALTVRKAQGYAIGVHKLGDTINNGGYGVHFALLDESASPKKSSKTSFVLFADLDGDKAYDYEEDIDCGSFSPMDSTGLIDECMEVLTIKSADIISGISYNDGEISLSPTDTLDILFKRPNPEPTFRVNDAEVNGGIVSVKIKISNNNDENDLVNRYITISNTGQISVSNQ